MTQSRGWLIDKSAYIRLLASHDPALWLERVERGLVSIAPVTLLEIGYSAKNADHWSAFQSTPPINLMPLQGLGTRSEMRALEVQGLLSRRGQHRAANLPDLLIAATAEESGLTVLHVDKDFKLIAEVTGQQVERLAGDF